MQSAEKLSTRGEKISSIDFPTDGWYPVAVPTTVISGLVQNNVYPDPYIGTNMKTIPGYKICKNEIFSNVDKPDDSPFKKPWWFRNEFTINKNSQNERIWLLFKGINYGAEIWLNGQQISKADNTKGTFRQYDFDVTQYLNPNRKNVLALEVFSPQSHVLGLTFIDWSPSPPDDSMGIWQPVYLRTTGPVFIKNTFVQSKLNTETLKEAELLINSELHNPTEKSISGTIEGKIEDIFFSQDIKLNPFQNKTCVFSTKKFPRLRINNPRLWWPYQLGIPELYKLSLNLKINGLVTDQAEITFGIRDIQSRINKHGSRLFTINGEDILIRGAAWAPDLLLRQSAFQDEMDIKFLKNLNMNTFRLEGKLATDYFWDLCDREGILVLAGWPCCNHWEKWENWKEGDLEIAKESLRSQLLRLRNHPSFTAWLYGSDFPPPESVER